MPWWCRRSARRPGPGIAGGAGFMNRASACSSSNLVGLRGPKICALNLAKGLHMSSVGADGRICSCTRLPRRWTHSAEVLCHPLGVYAFKSPGGAERYGCFVAPDGLGNQSYRYHALGSVGSSGARSRGQHCQPAYRRREGVQIVSHRVFGPRASCGIPISTRRRCVARARARTISKR
jgi:hypothetical protein